MLTFGYYQQQLNNIQIIIFSSLKVILILVCKKISVMKILRYLIRERQIKMDILETTTEVSAEELLANVSTFENIKLNVEHY